MKLTTEINNRIIKNNTNLEKVNSGNHEKVVLLIRDNNTKEVVYNKKTTNIWANIRNLMIMNGLTLENKEIELNEWVKPLTKKDIKVPNGFKQMKYGNETFEGYFINDEGIIWSDKQKRELKTSISNMGYRIYKTNDRTFQLHRLIASTFIEGFEDGLVVNHIDEDRLNNNLNNLEWVTPKQNFEHSREKWERSIGLR